MSIVNVLVIIVVKRVWLEKIGLSYSPIEWRQSETPSPVEYVVI